VNKHVTILGILFLVFHGLALVAAILIFGLMSGVGLLTGEVQAGGIMMIIGTVIAAIMAVMAIPGLIGGYGLLRRRKWARILVSILGFISIFEPPFGTVLGVYALWVLLHRETIPLFE
jgi:hypothetical protein